MATPQVGAGKTGGASPLSGSSGTTSNAVKKSASPAPSKTSALDAAGGMDLDSIKASESSPKIDSDKLTADVGKEGKPEQMTETDTQSVGNAEKNSGTAQTATGSVLLGVGAIVVWIWPIGTAIGAGLIVAGAVLNITGANASSQGDQMKATQNENKATQKEAMAGMTGGERNNFINQQMAGNEGAPQGGAVSSAGQMTNEQGLSTAKKGT